MKRNLSWKSVGQGRDIFVVGGAGKRGFRILFALSQNNGLDNSRRRKYQHARRTQPHRECAGLQTGPMGQFRPRLRPERAPKTANIATSGRPLPPGHSRLRHACILPSHKAESSHGVAQYGRPLIVPETRCLATLAGCQVPQNAGTLRLFRSWLLSPLIDDAPPRRHATRSETSSTQTRACRSGAQLGANDVPLPEERVSTGMSRHRYAGANGCCVQVLCGPFPLRAVIRHLMRVPGADCTMMRLQFQSRPRLWPNAASYCFASVANGPRTGIYARY